jgi:anaerobic selenocysteine-containing dehydrogenase
MSQKLDFFARHKGQSTWQEGEYTVTRTTVWSGPGCHDGCGVLYYVKDGVLEKVEGDPDNPYNQGTLCMRCLDMPEAVNHANRVTGPLKRAGKRGENKWEPISWEQAYDIIEAKVRAVWAEYGPLSIVSHIGTGRNNCHQIPYLSYAAFDSPNFSMGYLSGNSCFQPRSAAMASMQGEFLIADMSQQFESRYDEINTEWRLPEIIVNWGCNSVVSNSDNFYGHWIVECLQRGSKMITIDPTLTWMAAQSEYWLRLRPGTDTALAMGILNIIITEDLYDHDFVDKWTYGFAELSERVAEWTPEKTAEVCWVNKDELLAASRAYATAKPATIQWGLPIDQTTNGIQAAMAVNSLWTITGNCDVPGGNLIIHNAFEQNVSYNYGYMDLPGDVRAQRLGSEYPLMSKAGFSANAHADSVLRAIETSEPYPVRMVWMSSTNPIANMGGDAPRVYRALKSVDFVVVSDPFMTPTAVAFADVFLPAAMSAERNSQRCWWTPIRSMKKVVQFADTKSDDTIVTEMGKRLHPERFTWADDIGWIEDILQKETPGLPEELRNFDNFCAKVWLYDEYNYNYRKYEKGLLRADGQPGFNTPSGRIELYNTAFMLWGYDPLPYYEEPSCSPYSAPKLYAQYPFVLTTGARSYEFFHSEHRQLATMREFHPDPLFEMHPAKATELGLMEGEWCWIENQRGRCRQRLKLNPTLDARVVRAEHGWWFPEREAAEPTLFGVFDSNINNLTPQCENGPTGYGAPYKNQLCKVYKCTPENSVDSPDVMVTQKEGYSK